MGDFIDDLPEDDSQELYEPGVSGDEGAGGEDPNEDWSKHPGVQHIQSSMQRAHNEEMRKIQEQLTALQSQLENTAMSADQYRRRYEAVSEAVKTLGSEEQAVFIEQMAELEDLREFKKHSVEQQQQQQQRNQAQQAAAQWKSNKEAQSAAMGLDPYSPEIQSGIAKSLETGDDTFFMMGVQAAMKKKSAGQNSPDVEETPRQRPQPGVRPPSGGVTPNARTHEGRVNQLRKERQEAIDRAKASGGDWRLVRNDYAQKARALGIDPREIEPGS